MNAIRNWIMAPPVDIVTIPPDILALVGGDPIAAAALLRRGLTDQLTASAFLDPAVYQPASAVDLPDLAYGAELLIDASRSGQSILIWGDFDADGQTSTALLYDALRPLFLPDQLHWYIPDRLREGHGIGLAVLATLIERWHPALLLTCDTGVTAYEAIQYARDRGLLTIITDHHALPAELPAADAVINPQRLPIGHPLRALPGVGTAYKLIEQVYARCGMAGDQARLLDLVALGIVADVASLVDDTRYLLQIGLGHLRRAERPGIRALFDTARLEASTLTAEQIGFQLGPRLNAAGRLGDPGRAVELLTTADPTRAALLAQEFEGLNRRRRQLQRETEESARQLIAADPSLLDSAVLVLYRADWQPGILGPVAGRLAERYQRPAILLTAVDDPKVGNKGELLARGSGRSAAGLDMNAALTQISGLLTTFGGHPGAAGLTLPVASISAFRRALNEAFHDNLLAGDSSEESLTIDALLPLSQVTPIVAEAIGRLAPFGEGNPPIVLQADGVFISSHAFLDRAHAHRRLSIHSADQSESKSVSVFWWNSGDEIVPSDAVDLAYTVGTAPDGTLQITLIDYRLHEAPDSLRLAARQWIDCRTEAAPREALERLRTEIPTLTIWAEGYSQRESPGRGRYELTPGVPLAIFTTPPTVGILTETVTRLNPPVVYVFGIDPPPPLDSTQPTVFMRQLEGIARLVISRQAGQISLATLTTRLAQSEAVVRYALPCLSGIGHRWAGEQCTFFVDAELDSAPIVPRDPDWQIRLAAMLDETRAYRAYFRRAPITSHRINDDIVR
jgi:single-stranded-DNA-specific exonuclease